MAFSENSHRHKFDMYDLSGTREKTMWLLLPGGAIKRLLEPRPILKIMTFLSVDIVPRAAMFLKLTISLSVDVALRVASIWKNLIFLFT